MVKTKHRCCLDSQKCENIKSLADLTEHDSFVSFFLIEFLFHTINIHTPTVNIDCVSIDKRSKEKTKGFLSIL